MSFIFYRFKGVYDYYTRNPYKYAETFKLKILMDDLSQELLYEQNIYPIYMDYKERINKEVKEIREKEEKEEKEEKKKKGQASLFDLIADDLPVLEKKGKDYKQCFYWVDDDNMSKQKLVKDRLERHKSIPNRRPGIFTHSGPNTFLLRGFTEVYDFRTAIKNYFKYIRGRVDIDNMYLYVIKPHDNADVVIGVKEEVIGGSVAIFVEDYDIVRQIKLSDYF